ncbi:hypothetical protein GCM10010964_19620 [Caldovatus sediminis]|uniref:DUF3576 domain-containing protein n=2 Tax=Caldovatus sediminis TaxID=2041189 RepID=A0A8J2ZBA5_9PROT|nr:hypothetical protein GCM10010964_19620 [Caldovatus sediminis]
MSARLAYRAAAMSSRTSRIALALPLAALTFAAACGETRAVRNDEYVDDSRRAQVRGRLSGSSDGLLVFGVDRSRPPGNAGDPGGAGGGLGVNAYLWRATLDTLSFMPLASADPFGGVVITDWYTPPSEPSERFRATAYLLGRQLRSDGVRVSVHRQVRDRNGAWVDQPVSPGTAAALEDNILARARELRSQAIAAR